jgi:polar amino acid transport system substrate-binding protein
MLRYVILSFVSLFYLNACLPTSNCPKCSVQTPIVEPEKPIVRIGASSLNMPPYFITTENTGLEKDIIEASFAAKGYKAIFEYPNDRKRKFVENKVDCISTVLENSGLKGYYSEPIIPYNDMAIYLAKDNLRIKTTDDLKGKRVEAFNKADKQLGLTHLREEASYREHASKASQILMLYHEKIDVLLMDVRMFGFYHNKMYHKIRSIERHKKEEAKEQNKEYRLHPLEISLIFPEYSYQIACKTQQLRDDFNAGLKLIKQPNQTSEDKRSKYDIILENPAYNSSVFPELVASENGLD